MFGADSDVVTIQLFVDDPINPSEILTVPNATPYSDQVDVGGEIIVWSQHPAWDIHAYDVSSKMGFLVTDAPYEQDSVRASADGVIAWRDNRNGNKDIYAYMFDPSSPTIGTEIAVATYSVDEHMMGVDGRYVTYSRVCGSAEDIFLYNVDSQTEIQITYHCSGTGRTVSHSSPKRDFRDGILTWSELTTAGTNLDRWIYRPDMGEATVQIDPYYGLRVAAGHGRIAMVFDPDNQDQLPKVWENGVWATVVPDDGIDRGSSNLAVSDDRLYYCKEGFGQAIFSADFTPPHQELLFIEEAVSADSESLRISGDLIIWTNAGGLFYTYENAD